MRTTDDLILLRAGLFLLSLISAAALTAYNPLDDSPLWRPEAVRGFKLHGQDPGSARDPGSMVFSFRVQDGNGADLFFLKESDFTIYVGGRRAERFILQPSGPGYRVHIPRLPYQEENGTYPVRIVIAPENVTPYTYNAPVRARYKAVRINLILVVDCSTSMRQNDPGNYRAGAIRNIIRYGSQYDIISSLAVVRFSSHGEIIAPLTSLRNTSALERALSGINANGETNIADALNKAYQVLGTVPDGEKSVVILLTDGENNFPYSAEHARFAEAGVPVYTIGLSHKANRSFLQAIADDTGGEYHQIFNSFKLHQIYNQIIHEHLNKTIFVQFEGQVGPDGRTTVSFRPDAGLKKMNVLAFWQEGDMTISGPAGAVRYNESGHPQFSSFELRDLGKRTYTLSITNREKRNNSVSLIGFINSDLVINSFLPRKEFRLYEPVELQVLAFQDNEPIRRAEVTARVRSSSTNAVLALHDTGEYNDGRAGDGIYQNYFFNNAPGDYTVTFSIRGKSLDGRSFSEKRTARFRVTEKEVDTISLEPRDIDFSRTGANVWCYRSCRVRSGLDEPQSLQVFALPLTAGRTNSLPVRFKPDFTVLEKDRDRLLNISVHFPYCVDNGVYRTRVIFIRKDSAYSIPLTINYDKYRLMENAERIR